jgi:anthranilate synthase/aminodeoxychorismate synthase-like glutamine amidotransferase
MLLLLDNYDSFTYNLYDYLYQLGIECKVLRNDECTIADLEALPLKAIVISPGPGRPEDSGITMQVIEHFHAKLPILGICLGHQALGLYFGAKLVRGLEPVHGKTSLSSHNNNVVFEGIHSPFPVMRYHSLVLEQLDGTPLDIIATTAYGIAMAIKHRELPLYGFQFHPESILTPDGLKLLGNWWAGVTTPIPSLANR